MAANQLSQEEFERRLLDPEDHGKQPTATDLEGPDPSQSTVKPKPKEGPKGELQSTSSEGEEGKTPGGQTNFSVDDLTDEQLEQLLSKRGKKIVPASQAPEVSEKEKKEKREAGMLKFGLDTNRFTRATYDAYVADKARTPRELVFSAFIADNKDSGKTFEQLEQDFKDYYYEGVEEKYNHLTERRKKDMEREAARLLRTRYPEIHSLASDFDAHQSTQQSEGEKLQQKTQKLTTYRSALPTLFSSFQHIDLPIKESDEVTENISFEVPASVLRELQTHFESEGVAEKFIDATDQQLRDAIETAILKVTYQQRMSWAAKQYASKKLSQREIGRKHMDAEETPAGSTAPERDEQAYEMVKDYLPAAEKQLSMVKP